MNAITIKATELGLLTQRTWDTITQSERRGFVARILAARGQTNLANLVAAGNPNAQSFVFVNDKPNAT